MPKISTELLQSYFNGANRHPIYQDTVDLYESLRIHADGEFPKKLIEERRPSETEEILEYRQKTYKAITKLPIGKVLNSLSKIRRSPDYSMVFDKKIPARILPEETLERYINENLPGFTSITNWAFGILLKQNMIDANAVVAVIPDKLADANNYNKPVPILFNSDHVIEFNEMQQFAILKSRRKVNMIDENGQVNYNSGERYFYIDDREIITYDQTKDGFTPVATIPHPLGKMPVFKVKGEAFKQYDDKVVNKSRLDVMVPFLDEAAAEYSDLKGSKVQHLFPLFWYYQNTDCASCEGSGKKASTNGPVQCGSCGGGGKVKFSPFAHLQVKPPSLDEKTIPAPPAGYISRDTEILELQEKSVEKNKWKALAAINMQFLDQTPLAISGEAKQVDREELNNFVYNVAEDLIASIEKAIFWIGEWRYSFIIPDAENRKALLPKIPVPQNFDLLPADYLMKDLSEARTAKINPFLLATMEKELATKKFYTSPELAGTVQLFFDLDPLPGCTVDDKMSMLSNKAITQEDFIISSYLASFIRRAMREDKDFAQKPYEEQLKKLNEYAKEKKDSADAAAEAQEAQKLAVIKELNNNPKNKEDVA